MVPLKWDSAAAEQARDRLAYFEIDINDVANGVGLPRGLHRGVDHEAWSRHARDSLAQAQSRPQAIAILDNLAQQLVNDPTPWLRRR